MVSGCLRRAREGVWSIVMALVLLAPIAPSAQADDRQRAARVLLISSYHPSFPTFFDQISGIREAFRDAGYDGGEITIDIEFMDSKRFPGQQHLAEFSRMLAGKLRDVPPYDVIMTSDDSALHFALDIQQSLLNGRAIVFLGVNDVRFAKQLDNDPTVTGVVEAVSMKETLQLIERLTPKSDAFYVIGDANRTSLANITEFEQQKSALTRMSARVLSLYDLTYDELAARLRQVPADSAILLLGLYRDKDGKTKTYLEGLEFIREHTDAPVYSLWEHGMGFGVLGGKMVSHFEQGYVAARLAADILGGKTPHDLPVHAESPNVFTFDFDVMHRHGITLEELPENSKIINAPKAFLDRYKQLLPWLLAFFIIQSLVIAYLIFTVRNRRRAEKRAAKSEARFRDLAQASSDWFWEMDDQFRFTYFSERYEELTGLKIADRLGTTRQRFQTATDNAETRENWAKHMDDLMNHRPFKNFEYATSGDKGEEPRWIRVSGVPIFDDDGKFTGYRGVGSNIQKEVAAREAIIKARELAEASSKAKSEFLAHMSHELRTPLNGIIGFSEIMKDEMMGALGMPKYKEYATDVHDAATHLLCLLDDVLDISRIESMGIELEESDISLPDVLSATIRWTSELAAAHDVRVTLDAPASLPRLHADGRRLTQLFINLVGNAIKFTENGGRVEILATPSITGGLKVEITDTGIGIAEKYLGIIREPFGRVEGSQVRSFEGVGLGLSIADKIVSKHGGTLDIHSVEGEGTRVTVYFPKARVIGPNLTVIEGKFRV